MTVRRVALPDELAEQFPGCGGTGKACQAALKIQVLWSLTTGQLLQWLLEPGRASDALSAIAAAVPPATVVVDLRSGLLFLERFRRFGEAGAYWISRFQHHTKVFDEAGKLLPLLRFLRKSGKHGLVDVPVVLGEKERLALSPALPSVCHRKWRRGGGSKSAKRPATMAASRRRNTWISRNGRFSSPTARPRC